MDIPLGWQLFIQVILIAVNAVFASAEIAIVSMNELKLEKLAEYCDKILLLHQGKLAGVEDLDCHDKGFEEHVMELLSQ